MSHLLNSGTNPGTNFYANLPSNTRVDGNTAARWRCRLPRKLMFNSTWYVGLGEISYHHTWPSLGTSEPQFVDVFWQTRQRNTWPETRYMDDVNYERMLDKKLRISIPRSRHLNAERLESALNGLLRVGITARAVETEKHLENFKNFYISQSIHDDHPSNVEKRNFIKKVEQRIKDERHLARNFQFVYNSDAQRFYVEFESTAEEKTAFEDDDDKNETEFKDFCKIEKIELSQQLAYVLGYESRTKIIPNTMASYSPDLLGGISELYVYAPGLIEPVIVGDVMSPLLRIVNVRGRPDEPAQETYFTPHYHKLLVKEISEVLIEIRTSTGRLVPFEYGNSRITLHFKKQPYY